MSRMQDAMARLWARQSARNGVTVAYSRKADTANFTALIGSTLLRVMDMTGAVRTVRTDRDFLIAVAAFKPVFGEPKESDRISETINGVTAVYEVLPYGDEPGFRYSDEFRTVYRIHAKRISVAG